MADAEQDRLAASLRGFGPLGIVAFVVILAGNFLFPPLSAILALVWVHESRTPWSDLGFVRPRNWMLTIIIGIVFGVTFKLVMKTIVMPLLGAPAINPTYHYLAGNTAALPGTIFVMIVVAGFGEETLFRGYLFERLGKLFGSSAIATTAIVILTSIVFGAEHLYDQRLAGAEQAMIVGLVYGTIFAKTRQIWMLMIAHAAFDIAAVAIIYWNVESDVAHFFFR
jgi:uncharacterized protein